MRTLLYKIVQAAALLCCAISTLAQVQIKPAEVTSASDVQSPSGSVATGIVVLDASLNDAGEVVAVDAPREIVSLTSMAKSSIKTWVFKNASYDSLATPSIIRVAFAFRPRALAAAPPTFDPLVRPEDAPTEANSGYLPPGIVTAVYPAYPIDAATVGAVVVQVSVDAKGGVGEVKVIRSFDPFNKFAVEAAKKWQFRAATLDGEPVTSNLAIAFVFAAPIISAN
jgi:TonB family protein